MSKTNVPTICAYCRHYFTEREGRIWYDQYCRAAPEPGSGEIDPVTGKMKPTRYIHARRNKGNCPDFQHSQASEEFHKRIARTQT